jgi:hypothetical protein
MAEKCDFLFTTLPIITPYSLDPKLGDISAAQHHGGVRLPISHYSED